MVAKRRSAAKKKGKKRSTRVTSKPRGKRRSTRPRWVLPLWVAVVVGVFAAGFYLGGGFENWFPTDSGSATKVEEEKSKNTGSSTPKASRSTKDKPIAASTQPRPEAEYPVPSVAVEEPPANPDSMLPASGVSRIALVIDDLGRKVSDVKDLEALGVPMTFAVLPFEVRTPQVVEAIRAGGHEMICHLPMEPASGANPGPGALTSSMGVAELMAATESALDAVPGRIGVNNHMGSSLTTDRESMAAILGVVQQRGLYFLDSRTSAQSAGYSLAKEIGIPTTERQVFLDGELSADWIGGQFLRAMEVARRDGAAVVIGHPHQITLEALNEWVPRAQQAGYEFVLVSALLERSGGLVE